MTPVSPFGPQAPIRFGAGGGWRRYAGPGWTVHDEADFTWTDGPCARLRFRLGGIRRDARLTIRMTPFIVPGHCPVQDAFIYLNGLCLTYMRAVETVTVPLDVMRDQFSTGTNELMVAMPHAAVPAELGVSGDRRCLGFAFHSIDMVFTD